jgi:hypothetical protein
LDRCRGINNKEVAVFCTVDVGVKGVGFSLWTCSSESWELLVAFFVAAAVPALSAETWLELAREISATACPYLNTDAKSVNTPVRESIQTAVLVSTPGAEPRIGTRAESSRHSGTTSLQSPVQLVVVETMVIYPHSPARPNDIANLQGLAGCVVGVLCSGWGAGAVGYEARVWKGQTPREVMGARVELKVRKRGWEDRVVATRPALVRGKMQHKPITKTELNDVMHAIGLGFYHVEQMTIAAQMAAATQPLG